jgi:hypothetical protein
LAKALRLIADDLIESLAILVLVVVVRDALSGRLPFAQILFVSMRPQPIESPLGIGVSRESNQVDCIATSRVAVRIPAILFEADEQPAVIWEVLFVRGRAFAAFWPNRSRATSITGIRL